MLQHLIDAPIGSILLTYGTKLPGGLKGWLLKRAYNGIIKHQRALFPESKYVDAVHVQIKVGHGGRAGLWVSAEFPRVVETDMPIQPDTKARLYQYFANLDGAAEGVLAQYARSMVNKPYDYLQLIGIAAHEQKWIPKFMRKWLGFRIQKPGMLEVCSTMAAHALRKSVRSMGMSGHYIPLWPTDPFDVTPAHYENHVSFERIAEQNV